MALMLAPGDSRIHLVLNSIVLEETRRGVLREQDAGILSRVSKFLALLWANQLEQEMETVINVLQPGPLGIIEHKFSAKEISEAKATVHRAVANWQRNARLEEKNHVLKDYIQK